MIANGAFDQSTTSYRCLEAMWLSYNQSATRYVRAYAHSPFLVTRLLDETVCSEKRIKAANDYHRGMFDQQSLSDTRMSHLFCHQFAEFWKLWALSHRAGRIVVRWRFHLDSARSLHFSTDSFWHIKKKWTWRQTDASMKVRSLNVILCYCTGSFAQETLSNIAR